MYVSKRTTWLTDYETGVCLIRFTNCRFHFNDNFTSSYAQASPSAHPPVISWIFAVVLVCLCPCPSVCPSTPDPGPFTFVRSFGLVTASIISSLARVRVALDTSQSYVCLFTVLIINILLIHMECAHQEWTNASSSLNNKLCMKNLLRIPLEPSLPAFNWLFTNRLTFTILMKCKSTGVHFHLSHWQFSTTTNDRCKDDNSNFLFRDSHTLHCCVLNEVSTPQGVLAFNECVY